MINFVILAFYVDDILWSSNNTDRLKTEKEDVAKKLQVEDVGKVS